MKYAWIEELVDGEEVLVDGPEILDVGDVSFDPPQFEQVSQEPPVFEQVGTGNGPVVGLNRSGQGLESTGNITPQHLVWGMDNEAYLVISKVFTPKTKEVKDAEKAEKDAIKLAEHTLKAELKAVEDTFIATAYAPVEVVVPEGTYTFRGGDESALFIDLGVRLAERLGETSVTLIDIGDAEVIFPLSSAILVLIAVGQAFRAPYFVMKAGKKAKKDK